MPLTYKTETPTDYVMVDEMGNEQLIPKAAFGSGPIAPPPNLSQGADPLTMPYIPEIGKGYVPSAAPPAQLPSASPLMMPSERNTTEARATSGSTITTKTPNRGLMGQASSDLAKADVAAGEEKAATENQATMLNEAAQREADVSKSEAQFKNRAFEKYYKDTVQKDKEGNPVLDSQGNPVPNTDSIEAINQWERGATAKAQAELDEANKAAANIQKDPGWWETRSEGQKVATVISLALGGFVEGGGGHSSALDIITGAIDRHVNDVMNNLALKKWKAGERKSSAEEALRAVPNAAIQRRAVTTAAYDAAIKNIEAVSQGNNSEAVLKRGQALVYGLQAKKAQDDKAFLTDRAEAARTAAVQLAGVDVQRQELGLRRQEMEARIAEADRKREAAGANESLKIYKTLDPLTGGSFYLKPGMEKKAEELNSEADKLIPVIGALNKIKSLMGDMQSRKMPWDEGRAEVRAIATSMLLDLGKQKQGRMTDKDWKIMADILPPDPQEVMQWGNNYRLVDSLKEKTMSDWTDALNHYGERKIGEAGKPGSDTRVKFLWDDPYPNDVQYGRTAGVWGSSEPPAHPEYGSMADIGMRMGWIPKPPGLVYPPSPEQAGAREGLSKIRTP